MDGSKNNARGVRNLLEAAIARQAGRLADDESVDPVELTPADLPEPQDDDARPLGLYL
jgi:hypothetical protein